MAAIPRSGLEVPAGHIMMRPGHPGLVVGVPHGTSDPNTGYIADEVARRSGFGLVVATGSGPARDEPSGAARAAYEAYEQHVRNVAGGPLRLYVEIHGNGREDAGRIEVATAGVDLEHARQLKTLFELTRDAYLRTVAERPAEPRLAILVEPADRVSYAATGAKRDGILRLPERALHIELPRAARRELRELYTAIIADFLTQAALLRPLP